MILSKIHKPPKADIDQVWHIALAKGVVIRLITVFTPYTFVVQKKGEYYGTKIQFFYRGRRDKA